MHDADLKCRHFGIFAKSPIRNQIRYFRFYLILKLFPTFRLSDSTALILTYIMQGEMDFINSVCPCAGLSMLNRQREGNVSFLSAFDKLLSTHLQFRLVFFIKSLSLSQCGQFRLVFFIKSLSLSQCGRGADAAQNVWMLKSAEYVLSVVKPKVSVDRLRTQ